MSDHSSSGHVLRVAIVGGGTAGLAAALRLKERIPASSLELDIFEASDVLGGNNQSFDGVPLFFSCFRSSSATVMMEYMKKLGVKATSCDFTSLSLKDKKGGKQTDMSEMSAANTSSQKHSVDMKLLEAKTYEERKTSVSSISTSVSTCASLGTTLKAGSTGMQNELLTKDDVDSSSEVSSSASTAASKSTVNMVSSKKSPVGAVSEYKCTTFEQAVTKAVCLYQERLSTSSLRLRILPSASYMENKLWSEITSSPQAYKMLSQAAGINYFYSSRDQAFSEKHVKEYFRLNCGTYYWSIENGRNDLLIERMRARLTEGAKKSSGDSKHQTPGWLGCVKVAKADANAEKECDDPGMEVAGNSGGGKVMIHCGTRCTSIEPLPDGTVRLHYESPSDEKSSQNSHFQDEDSKNQKTACFDQVIICVHPHVAKKLLKNCAPLQSLLDDIPFHPVHAHAIVHTDQSVKCTSSSGRRSALTYEIGQDGSWILHIDCQQYYKMKKGKGNGNIVSIWYGPDTCDSIDPNLIKGKFSTTLSKSTAHDQGTEQDVENALRGRLRKHHQECGSNVYLCGSYYCYEQWSQDAFAMAVEVADSVVSKFHQRMQSQQKATHQKLVEL
eukprot:gnl/MRDRNA2_/MRDRNA2_31757_c0_seq1.p1 gnl/MRDRNA2_/MRDRNA2_31757_c0~~gnl/MRDRNA2_/MRDRNA2_31757_c0_seq1.p1  ORF type:complete len:613 (+),score=111.05 gnl/MRDRNA2_/MRDRNA2_31757_c0_seq1:69-1907(+)